MYQEITNEAKQIIEKEFMDGHHKIFNTISIKLSMDEVKEEDIFVSAKDIKLISTLSKSVSLKTINEGEQAQVIAGKKKQLLNF